MIQGQVTTINVNQNNNITGIHIPNQKNKVKISQYARDSNLFLKNQESVNNALTFFCTLNKAMGTTINLEKKHSITNEHWKQIQKITPKITIKKQFETTKNLGIYFNENLKNVSQINWDNILQKIEKHINKLSPRILSLYGKTILINTLILSKTCYLSNVFPNGCKNSTQNK